MSRFARWGLIGAAALMGVALLATVWSTYRGVSNASATLSRGQASSFFERVRARLNQLPGPPTGQDMEAILADYGHDGLRYVATLDADGHIVIDGGASVSSRAQLEEEIARARPGSPVTVGGRVRLLVRRPSAGPGVRDPRSTPGPTPFVVEFEPQVADALRAGARRTLGIGALAAGGLLLLAIGLVRWFLRREALERQLERGRRLAHLGEMSAVLAHEIRNPLASLKGNAQLLARALPEGEKPRAKAERVVAEAIRLEALCNDLLDFVRAGEIERAEADPAALLRDAAAAVGANGAIGLETAGAPSRWPLDGDRIRQVLTNLLENATQAGGERVEASVSLERERLTYVVRDWGTGIPEEDMEKIYEPFYTRRTRGTGLGLAVAKRLVELHGGTITAANAAGGGAVFRVFLPRG